ncbi:hypothetical protein INR49_001478 [Caranx melampygus]|nr:hypothetical protein INR49_001478 [Caranx melampygus]
MGVQTASPIPSVPDRVRALVGSCVVIPCSFTPLAPHSLRGRKERVDVRLRFRGGGHLFPLRSTAFNSEDRDQVSRDFQGRASLSGRITEGDCSVKMERISLDDSRMFEIALKRETPEAPVIGGMLSGTEGQLVTLNCSATYYCPSRPPTLQWSWERGGHLNSSELGEVQTLHPEPHRLMLVAPLSFTVSHQVKPRLRCEVNYPGAKTLATSKELHVTFPPKEVKVQVQSLTVQEGGNALLVCSCKADPPVSEYRWSYTQHGHTVHLHQRTHTVRVYNVTRDMRVRCSAQNLIGRGESRPTPLNIQYKPLILHPSSTCVLEEMELLCRCSVDSNPKPAVTWSVNGTVPPQDYNVSVTSEPLMLTVTLKGRMDKPLTVICFAFNALGNDSLVLLQGREETASLWWMVIPAVAICLVISLLFLIFFCCRKRPGKNVLSRHPAVYPEGLGIYQDRMPLYINCTEVTHIYTNGSYQLVYQNCTPFFVHTNQIRPMGRRGGERRRGEGAGIDRRALGVRGTREVQGVSSNNMPEIKLKHVVSCSTEDTTHKADNLLSPDTYRKWKAARPGEKQTSVILQLEKEEQIHSIDIGNEGSAFIEVLVGNSSAARDQDYEVLLVTSSFMSPTESRNGTNMNRVRFFGPNQLQKSTAQEKWDKVKIVCSQPYSKNIAYGLAFVKFHSPPDKNDPPPTASPKLTKLGQFKVKDESPSAGPSLQPGSLFFNRDSATKPSTSLKVSPQSEKLSYAAAALQAGGTSPSPGQASSSTSASPQFSKERQSASGPPSKKISPSVSPEGKAATPKHKPSPAGTSSPSAAKASLTQKSADKKRESQSKSEPKPKQQKAKSEGAQQVPFNRIMEGVVFVLSGFQNPFRGELREKALDMGAKYRPDWTPDSTHLICAFANTPKYSQVKSAGGIIVRKEWVMDCHKRKQKISYKRYLMDGAESSSEDEMEADDQSEEEVNTKTPQKQERQVTPKKTPEKRSKDDDDEYAGSTDLDEPGDDDESAVDTEDELQRVENESRQKKAAAKVKTVKEEDPYGGSTDENTDAEVEEDHPIPELPGRDVQPSSVIEDYMTEKVQFVVTSEGWHDSFEDALMENGNLNFVKPAWIYAINERQKMLPYQPYTVVP